jgi:hypothetical protein
MAQNKRAGKKSLAQNDFLEPLAPISVSATDVGTNRSFNDGATSVSFSLPENSPAATSYTVTATAAGQTTRTATGSSSPITVTGLVSNVTYGVVVTATNASGTSLASASTNVTATTVPATPNAPTVSTVGGAAQDNVSWSAPANGGKSITNYNWESNDSKSGNTANTSVTVNQEAGTTQAYRVRAQNANGFSAFSSYSSNVTTFSFTPYAFTPYSFVPFSFVPFSFTPYAFTPYSFVPYSFVPYSFVPYAFVPYAFVPYSFTPQAYSFVPYAFTPSGFFFLPAFIV